MANTSNKKKTTKKVVKKKQPLLPLQLLIKPDYEKYVNVNRWFSYDNISTFIIVGGRGIGKTTGLGIHVLQDFISKGDEFVYVRRYIKELTKAKGFLAPIGTPEPKVIGLSTGAYMWTHNKERIGYGLALSSQQSFKSGFDFRKVKTLIFDEAILKRGGMYRYLDNEIEMLFELISTIFRDRTGYRIFILGNNADVFNPYWEYFKIPNFDRNFIDKERGLYCEKASNSPVLLEAEKKTPLYKLTQGTSYFKYHYENELLGQKNHIRIAPKPLKAVLLVRFVVNGYTLNIYRVKQEELFLEIREKVIKDDKSFTILDDMELNYYHVRELRKTDLFNFISHMFYLDGIVYENELAYAIMANVMDLL